MKIGLIGCGRVGLTMAYFLKKQNKLSGVYDKNKAALVRAIKLLKISRNPDYVKLIKNSVVLLFATPDDEILNAYIRARRYIEGKKYLFHFSGLLPAEIFPEGKNIYRASIHPFATFPKIIIPPKKNKYILFLQGDKEALRVVPAIFSKQFFLIRRIDKLSKPFYHLLGVYSSNFIVALIEAIHIIGRKAKLDKKTFDKVVFQILNETLENIKKYQLKESLSGPVVRGDINTIRKHLQILYPFPELYNLYCALSRIILKYAPSQSRKTLEKILKKN